MLVSVRGRHHSVARPGERSGWEASNELAMVMVMFPCDTAQLEMRMREVATDGAGSFVDEMRAGYPHRLRCLRPAR